MRRRPGPCLVLAGPGSGKTHVIAERVFYLIHDLGADPSAILVLSFSRAAAAQMQSRCLALAGRSGITSGQLGLVTFGTFHSVMYNILRTDARSPLKPVPEKVRDGLLLSLLEKELGEAPKDPDSALFLIKGAISRRKCGLESSGKILPAGLSAEGCARIRTAYDAWLSANGYLDFDDMILACRSLLTEDEALRKKLRGRWRHILIDEFQDVSPIQYEAVQLIAGECGDIFAVGDDDQSIYAFRGADPGVAMRFLSDHPDAGPVVLRHNYRCGRHILTAAQRVIDENRERIRRPMPAPHGEGSCVRLISVSDREEMLRYMRGRIEELSPTPEHPVAVIVRSRIQVSRLVRALGAGAAGGAEDPFRQTISREVLGYIEAARQAADGAVDRGVLFRIMEHPARYLDREAIPPGRVPLSVIAAQSRAGGILAADLRMLSRLTGSSPLFLSYLAGTMGYAADIEARFPGEVRDLDAFLLSIVGGGGEGAGSGDATGQPGQGSAQADPSVRILTMHVAKGLEFDHVILPELNEGILPSRHAQSPGAVEEERRLLYVAMTRARETLDLIYIEGTKQSPRRPSRFLQVLMPRGETHRVQGKKSAASSARNR